MSTNRYVVAPREPTWQMVNAFIVATDAPFACRDGYKAMLAAIPDDPDAPVLVSQEYVKAVEDFCVVSWISPPKPDADYDTVRKALHDVACWSAQLETDPATNGGKVLVERDELKRLRKDAERYRCLSRALDDGFWQVGEVEILDSWGRSQLNLIADSCEMNSRIDAALRHLNAIRPDEKEGG